MKDFAEKFYKSPSWQNCRDSYMRKVGGLCEECLKEGHVTPAEEVHHIKHIDIWNINDPNITLNHANLRALCREHHRRMHGRSKRYRLDEQGRVIPI